MRGSAGAWSRLGMVGLALAAGLGPVRAEPPPTPVLTVPRQIDGDSVLAAVEPDAIRAIDAPRFVHGEAATRQMADDEVVLALHLGGDARAYPLGFLSAHEIVNDRFDDLPVAVTW